MAILIPTSTELLNVFDLGGAAALQGLANATTALAKLRQDTRALKPGKVAGALIRWPAGNRFAYYRVKSARPLCLEHIPVPTGAALAPEQIAGIKLAEVKLRVDKEKRWM